MNIFIILYIFAIFTNPKVLFSHLTENILLRSQQEKYPFFRSETFIIVVCHVNSLNENVKYKIK